MATGRNDGTAGVQWTRFARTAGRGEGGLFYGYHFQDFHGYKSRYFALVGVRSLENEQKFELYMSIERVAKLGETEETAWITEEQASQLIEELNPEEARDLELEFAAGRLHTVRCNWKVMQVVSEAARKRTEAPGTFGIYGVFSEMGATKFHRPTYSD